MSPEPSPQPTNPERTLSHSVPIKPTSKARIAFDKETGEIVVFRKDLDSQNRYHGYVKNWNEANQEEKNALIRGGWFTPKGRIKK